MLKNYSDVWYISMPCCYPNPEWIMKIPHITYDDSNVLSGKRSIHIWEDSNLKRYIKNV